MTTRSRKYGIIVIAAVLLVALAFAGSASAADDVNANTVDVTTIDDLIANLKAGNDVRLTANIEIENEEPKVLDLNGHQIQMNGKQFVVSTGANLTLTDNAGHGKIHPTGNARVVKIKKGGTFIMNKGEIDFRLEEEGEGGMADVEGTFIMNGGRVHMLGPEEGAFAYIHNGGTFTMNGGTFECGFSSYSVYIESGSTFNMKGGTISNSGVYVGQDARFIMDGGGLKNCQAFSLSRGGGVYVAMDGNFTMNGGGIDDCLGTDGGGGVYVENGGTFTLNGGSIFRCRSVFIYGSPNGNIGGGVYVVNGARFTMNGGSIVECSASKSGGAVYIDDADFTMNGGKIRDCHANNDDGGAVFIKNGKFTLNDGSIQQCSAEDSGGGVYVNSGSDAQFIMNGGEIKNCRIKTTTGQPQDEGGGVYLEGEGSTFTMRGGLIKGCYAEDFGGGVFVDDSAVFNMQGGMITECRVDDDYGGGVYVDDASAGFRDGEIHISGNAIVINNKKGGSTNNLYLEDDDLLFLEGDFTGCIGISNQDDEFGSHNGHKGAEFFFKDGDDIRGKNSGGDLKFGDRIPEFKDITPETTGLVKASGSLTDTSKPYKVSAGQTIRMMTPIVIGAGTAENPVTVQIDGTLFSAKQWPVITVDKGKYLSVSGKGVISDGWSIGYNGGGINLREGSSLTLDGVTISNNVADKNGGGISGDKDTSIVIKSGKIENNKAGEDGGGISSQGVLVLMSGGEIKGNTAGKNGGGMYVSENTVFNIGDSATVIENKKGDTADNVYLGSYERLTLIGSLAGTVGISYAGGIPATGNQFGFAPSASSSGADNFQADGYDLEGKISNKKLVWTEKRPSTMVTFNPGEGGRVSPSSKKVFVGEPYGILPNPVLPLHLFAGWYNSTEYTGDEITKDTIVPADLGPTQTLYAKWRGPIVTVTFDAKEGTVSPLSKHVIYHEKYGELPIPLREGWSFAGWYLEGTLTRIFKDMIVSKNKNHTLYAKWKEGPVNVTLDTNGGKALDPITVYPGKPYSALPIPDPSVTGYTFVGWYLTPDFSGAKITNETIVATTEDHTLHAKWFGPFIVSNTNIDFGTVFEGDTPSMMDDMIYNGLSDSITLTFPSGTFKFMDTGGNKSGQSVSILQNTGYSFSITPLENTKGFYSATIPIRDSASALLGNLSVTMSVVAKDLETDEKVSSPALPIVYNLIDAKNSSIAWLVGVEGENNLKVDGKGTATISYGSKNDADNCYLRITSVTSKPAAIDNAIMLSAQSRITAHYPSKNLENIDRNHAGTYSVDLGLTDVLRNLPTFTGTFNESLTPMITAMNYTSVVMVSPVNGKNALDTMNDLIKDKGVEVTFTVPVKQLPKSIDLAESVSVFSVDADGNVDKIKPDSAEKVGDEYVVTARGSSLSSYVLAFDNKLGYYSITPLGGWHGDIVPDYLYHLAGDSVSVTSVPDEDYEYRGLLIFNETSYLDMATDTFSMPPEHVYLYGVFTEHQPTYKVTFEMNDHGIPIPEQHVAPGDTVTKPEDPVEEGYVFGGWFSDSALTTLYDFDTPVTDDLTLYAKWTASHRGHSASIPKDYSPSGYVTPMDQETATPTTTPTLAAPTMMPITTPMQTQKSPAPLAGLLFGLGAAALLIRMRR